jgi:hypothetical protein
MEYIDILKYWLKFTDYNTEQTVWKLFSKSYEFHEKNKKLIKFFNEWDETGIIPVLYTKFIFLDMIKCQMVSLYDFLQNNITDLNAIKTLYNEFESEKFHQLEKTFLKSFEQILVKLQHNKLIGELNTDVLLKNCKNILETVQDLNVDIYKKGGTIKPFDNFSNKVYVFKSVSQCLLTLEQAPDSVYLCYISKENSPDGFFGFYIKNNGNLFSINERLDEDFIGQHKHMRNNRYTENKKYDLFPYEIVSFSGEDYKGYATSHTVNEETIDFDKLEIDSLLKIVVMFFLLGKKYTGKTLPDEIVYVDSLLDINVSTAINLNKNELIPYVNKSELVKTHKEFTINLPETEFFDGSLCEKFNYTENKNYKECGRFQNINQGMVDKFKTGFDLAAVIKNAFETDKTKLLLNSDVGSTIPENYVWNNEFIGNKNKLELQAFFDARKKLAKHITQKQIESFNQFGGLEKFKKWYERLLVNNLDKIKKICMEVYDNPEFGKREYNYNFRFENEKRVCTWVKYSNADDRESFNFYTLQTKIHNINHIFNPYCWGDKVICKDIENEVQCYHYFKFTMMNLEHLKEFFNTEFPDFCEGYWSINQSFKPYTGNSILDVVDPVDELNSILCSRDLNYKFNFDFWIGFSKSTFNKMKKGIKRV